MKVGLTRNESLSAPFGYLSDLIAIQQINAGATRKKTAEDEENDFFDMPC